MNEKKDFWVFPTVISQFNLADDFENFDNITSFIEEEDPSVNMLIKNGHRSKSSKFLEKLPDLKNKIQNCINQYTDNLGLTECEISYSWCNIYSQNGYIKPHRHELSIVSGVFYAKADEYSGELVFDNPLNMFRVNEISTKKTEYTTHDFKFGVSSGDLIIFPSWIMHYSENNFSNARYLISFDTRIKNYGLDT
jgi:uncharacterized protein (TIGR02466 family)